MSNLGIQDLVDESRRLLGLGGYTQLKAVENAINNLLPQAGDVLGFLSPDLASTEPERAVMVLSLGVTPYAVAWDVIFGEVMDVLETETED